MVNGLLGDHLHDRQNSLAIEMAFYHHNRPLPLTSAAILRAHPQPSAKLCVLVHGLSCHEGIWSYSDPAHPGRDTSYGALLQADLGYTPLYVRYNTGLPLAENGARLAALLDELVACYPAPIADIVLIGHSMGGLILRYACHAGVLRQAAWTPQVRKVFYLATPHDGALLARLAHAATTVLHGVPHPITRLIGAILDRRSQGLKDLQVGARHDADSDLPEGMVEDHGQGVPWLASAQHYLIAGTLTGDPQHAVAVLFGDGLVHVPHHAHARHQEPSPPIPRDHVRLFAGTHHLRLTRDPAVYQQIKQWCTGAEEER
jgi:pimeloyl-ACP methyl ester carboxylesterase